MILDKIYISNTEPIVTNVLWAKPLDGGAFSLYAFLSGKWGLLKLMNDNGTPYPEDDTPGGSADDCYTKEEIDNKLADILGLDAEGVAELKALIEDEDSLTGLLSEIARKANTVLLSDYVESDDPLPTDCIYKRIVGGSGREFKYLLPKEVRYSGDSYLIFRVPDDTDESFVYIVFKREHRTTTMQYYYNASYNTSTDEVPAWVEDAFGYTRSEVNNLLNNKVDKEQGKGLSTNDYTTEEKSKLGALPMNSELTTLLNGKADVGRVEDIEDALSVVESETADATDYTTETTSVSTDNITINPVAVRKSPIYSVYKQGGGQESIEGVFSPGYTDGSYILNVQIAQAGTVKIDSIRTRYYSGYYPIVYFYFTPTGGEKVKVAEIAKASAGTPIGYKYEEPTVSINAPGAGVLSIELWLYDIDTYNTIPAFFWMEYERSSVVYYAITSISFEQSSLTGFVNNGAYNSTTKKIELKHDSDILAEIDATDIFDSDNYYDKNDVNGLLAGKENMMPITTATGVTLSAVVGNYYRLDNVGTLTVTLPTTVGATKLQAITFLLVCGSSALVTFAPQGSETILYQEDFALEADTTYEVTALWNGSEWTLSRVIYE